MFSRKLLFVKYIVKLKHDNFDLALQCILRSDGEDRTKSKLTISLHESITEDRKFNLSRFLFGQFLNGPIPSNYNILLMQSGIPSDILLVSKKKKN